MLKYKKAPGPDRIRNEMLKTGIFTLKRLSVIYLILFLKVDYIFP